LSAAPPGDDERPRLDAGSLAERLATWHRAIGSELPGKDLELYHRAALTLRVSDRGESGRKHEVDTQYGQDEGLALRATSRGGSESAFAATSGSTPSSLRWVVDRCRNPRAFVADRGLWARDGGAAMVDQDGEPELPPLEAVLGWLERARESLFDGGRKGPDPLELSVEVAAVVESWVADGGLRASRARIRGWGLMRIREPWNGDRASGPVLVARRRWSELPPDAWRTVLEDRRVPDRGDDPPPTAAVPVLFNPECSALLVLALAKTLHTEAREPGIEVGPAWKVYDDPGHAQALYGGSFDDAGFPTSRKRLANGHRTSGRIESRGHYRRPSFRDRPIPLPSHLTVSPTASGAPAEGVLATAVSLHPVESRRWVLRIEGALLHHGRPGPILRSSFVSISPEDLALRCVATVGPPRSSHLGVETPALVFDDLSLRT
jgi:hypothetical protein